MSITTFNPFECPVCLEFYDDNYIPTTFPCGHSCCINHVHLLECCFACRSAIPAQRLCQPNYALRDGSIIFRKLLTVYCPAEVADTFLGQQNFSLPVSSTKHVARSVTTTASTNTSSTPSCRSSISTAASAASSSSLNTTSITRNSPSTLVTNTTNNHNRYSTMNNLRINQYVCEVKSCGHTCSPSSLARCCACMDRRPMQTEGTYPIYIDGLGWSNTGPRNAGYCPLCSTGHVNKLIVQEKSCGHTCSPSTLTHCCACMDRRPIEFGNTYPIYIDGLGWSNIGPRNAGYCPACK
jgi:hypothetical protein